METACQGHGWDRSVSYLEQLLAAADEGSQGFTREKTIS